MYSLTHHIHSDVSCIQDAVYSNHDQFIYTDYLQYLTALLIGLGMDRPILYPPSAPHSPVLTTPPEWEWLLKFTNSVLLTDCFREHKMVPDSAIERVACLSEAKIDQEEKYNPRVYSTQYAFHTYTNYIFMQDNSVWTIAMDKQMMDWVSLRPGVCVYPADTV